MPIKFIKRVPPPQPVPPPTYGLVGLSKEDADLLARAIGFTVTDHLALRESEKNRLWRMRAVLHGNAQEEGK